MDEVLRRAVRLRAANVCEYCLMPQAISELPFELDHIIALQHGGPTVLDNLAWACLHCNGNKGPNLAGLDPLTGKLTPLFNPRRHKWSRHFRWNGPFVIGRTPIGRTTLYVLKMNHDTLVDSRILLIDEGTFPPR